MSFLFDDTPPDDEAIEQLGAIVDAISGDYDEMDVSEAWDVAHELGYTEEQ